MLEAIVAFGLLAMVLAFALPALTGAAARQAGRIQSLQATEFAASVLEEYRATFPVMAASGTDPSGWVWQISERITAPDGPTSLDTAMVLVAVTLDVWHRDRPDNRFAFETIVARPRP